MFFHEMAGPLRGFEHLQKGRHLFEASAIHDTPRRQKETALKRLVVTEPRPILATFAADVEGSDTSPQKLFFHRTHDRQMSARTAAG
jgi:hypothetical protein